MTETKKMIETFLNVPSETRRIEFKRLGNEKAIVAKLIQSIVAKSMGKSRTFDEVRYSFQKER